MEYVITGKPAQDYYRFLFNVNQEFKKQPIPIPKLKPYWVVENLKDFVMFDYDKFNSQGYGELKLPKSVEEYIKENPLTSSFRFIVDAETFFQFADKDVKPNKLEVEKVVIKDGGISFYTRHPEVKLNMITVGEYYSNPRVIFNFRKKVKRIIDPKNQIVSSMGGVTIKEIKEPQWKKVFKVIIPINGDQARLEHFLYKENDDELSILLRPKDIISNKIGTKLHLSAFEDSEVTRYIQVELESNNYKANFLFRVVVIRTTI